MRNIGGGIRLRGVSFRSLGLCCFVGCLCRVGGEAVASCIHCVYSECLMLFFFFINLHLSKKKKSFAEVVRSEGPVKLQVPLFEGRYLDLLPAVRPAASKEGRLALDCFVIEKELLGKDLLLKLQGNEHPSRFLSACGTPGSARKILPHLNLRTWRNRLVRMMGWVVGSLIGCSFAFGLCLKPTFSFKGFRLGWVMTKPKSKKRIKVTG
jgi:hypothetical protein